jgi:hypothetical protein
LSLSEIPLKYVVVINNIRVLGRRFDKAVLLALAIGVISAWPFFVYAGLPDSTDAELHIFRIAELGHSLRAGNPYPRWAANFYHGYGYPIFNYYAPLTYHLGNWLTLLNPARAGQGAKAIFVLAALLGTLGAYALGREFGGQGGGLIGAAAFATTPYVMLINPHVRGDLAEVFALALLPGTLWLWECLWRAGGKVTLGLAVFSAAAVLLSHNLTGLTLMLLLVLLSGWHWLALRRRERFTWGLLAGILVIGLTAFFWLPFVLERQFIKLDVAGDGHYDFRNHFVLLYELLAPLRPLDWRAATPQPPMTASPLHILLALAGFGVVVVQRNKVRPVLFYVLCGLVCLWLVTPASRFVWETVPSMALFQFPWRFLGPLAALMIPPIASIGTVKLPPRRYTAILTGLLTVILLFALPGLYPTPWSSDAFGDASPAALLDQELQGRWRGTTSTNDFVPVTVEMIPGPQVSLLDSYRDPPIDRVNRYTVPAEATVDVQADVPWRNRFLVQTPRKFLLRLYLFDFPGWTAYIDGQEVPIEIAHPEGFVTVWIPPGNHEVVVAFEDTPPRVAGWLIAGVSAIVFLAALWRFPKSPPSSSTVAASQDGLALKWMALCVVCLVGLKGLVFDPAGWFHYTSPQGEALGVQRMQRADIGGEIAMLGFDVSGTQMRAGRAVDVTIYWMAQRPMTETYQSFVHMVYPEGKIWVQSDHLNPAGFPTNLWPTDRYIRDKHRLMLPPDLPPGDYALSVGIYRLQDNERVPVLSAESGARFDTIVLDTTIHVRR